MRAAVINRYGDTSVFEIKEISKPTYRAHQVLVRVAAAGINPVDWKLRKGMFRYVLPIKFPAILGFDICGEIVEVGNQTKLFKPGDWILARTNYFPGRGYAEYIALDENYIVAKPQNITAIEAASLPIASLTALQSLRNYGRLKSGSEVLIIGASGGVGLFAVQLAKVLGAKVTAVCSTKNWDFVKALGADIIIDYTVSPIFANNKQYDLIFDTVAKHSYSHVKSFLTSNGIYVSTVLSFQAAFSFVTNLVTAKKCYAMLMKNRISDLKYIVNLLAEQKIKTFIDSVYPLDQVAEAHKRSESERARGKIVLDMIHS